MRESNRANGPTQAPETSLLCSRLREQWLWHRGKQMQRDEVSPVIIIEDTLPNSRSAENVATTEYQDVHLLRQ